MSQSRLIRYAPRVDFVGHLESLESDLKEIAARIAGEAGKASLIQRAGHATGASRRAKEIYDDECRTLIQAVYAEDFARFGYSKEIV